MLISAHATVQLATLQEQSPTPPQAIRATIVNNWPAGTRPTDAIRPSAAEPQASLVTGDSHVSEPKEVTRPSLGR